MAFYYYYYYYGECFLALGFALQTVSYSLQSWQRSHPNSRTLNLLPSVKTGQQLYILGGATFLFTNFFTHDLTSRPASAEAACVLCESSVVMSSLIIKGHSLQKACQV